MNTNTQPVLQAWLASSTDAQKVAARWDGLFIGASSTIIFISATFLHITLSSTDIITLAAGVSITIGAIVFLYGGIRAMFVMFGTLHKVGTVQGYK